MADAILVVNAGSSSLKFSVFTPTAGGPEPHLSGLLEELYGAARFKARDAAGKPLGTHEWPTGAPPGHDGAIDYLFEWLRRQGGGHRLLGVGHRVVHGGTQYAAPVLVTPAALATLDALVPLAPLHQPHNLAGIRAIAARLPDLPQVACFDTAFHRTQPRLAQMYALPREMTEAGVRRYGFHGLSYEYIASVLARYDAAAAAGRTVVLHLGNGASLCAMASGRSIASTMGFTALEGLPMGTRTGSLDPGVLLWLMDERRMDARAIEAVLYKKSGLLGVSGIASDMRVLLESTDPHAREAVDLFCYRIARELGSAAAALGGLDAIVFTAGIGEHAAPVREIVCRHAAWLGLVFDPTANAAGGPRISATSSRVSAWVIPTNEELVIARHTCALVAH